jgi:hypothetical protein
MANTYYTRGTAAHWAKINRVLPLGEIGFENDTNKFKIGNGRDRWRDLNYAVGLNKNGILTADGSGNISIASKQTIESLLTGEVSTHTHAGGGGSSSNGYGYQVDEATRVYSKLGVAGRVVHDKIRQCVQNDNGTINYFLDPANGWDKENHLPSKRFADKAQSAAVIDTIVSLNAFTAVVAGQGISNRRGEYAVVITALDQSNVIVDEIAPVHKVYGKSTTTTEDHLIDSVNAFTNINVGDIVHNRSTGDKARVTEVATGDLTLSGDIFQNVTPGEYYSIYAPFLADNEEFEIHTAVVDGTDGQVMVYIPKFYYKYSYATGVHGWMISDTLETGYEVHPAFVVDGTEVDYITIGAFEGWQDGEEFAKLYSVVNKLPSANFTRAQFRTMAQARSASHTQMLWYQNYAIQLLYITWFGNWDSQAIIGKGMTYFGNGGAGVFGLWDDVNGTTRAVTKTGISLKNGVKTVGEFVDNNDPSAYMSLFGIENMYGNLYKFLDGVNIEQFSKKIYVCNTPSSLDDDTATGYADLGITYTPNDDEFSAVTLENTKKGIIPATYADSTPIIPDMFWLYSNNEVTWRVALSGGYFSNGASAGVACLVADYDSADAGTNVGSRLCFCGALTEQQ